MLLEVIWFAVCYTIATFIRKPKEQQLVVIQAFFEYFQSTKPATLPLKPREPRTQTLNQMHTESLTSQHTTPAKHSAPLRLGHRLLELSEERAEKTLLSPPEAFWFFGFQVWVLGMSLFIGFHRGLRLRIGILDFWLRTSDIRIRVWVL